MNWVSLTYNLINTPPHFVWPSWVSDLQLLVTGDPARILLVLWPQERANLVNLDCLPTRDPGCEPRSVPGVRWSQKPRPLGESSKLLLILRPTPHHPPLWPNLAWSTWQRRQRPRASSSICTSKQISPWTSASGSTRLRLIQLSIPAGHRCSHLVSTYRTLALR